MERIQIVTQTDGRTTVASGETNTFPSLVTQYNRQLHIWDCWQFSPVCAAVRPLVHV